MPNTNRSRHSLSVLVTLCAACTWTVGAHAADAFAADSSWMTGDWGGERTALLDKGVDIQMNYTGESASNVHGGYDKHDHTTKYADQFSLGAAIDLQKLMGWKDTHAMIGLTNRNGDETINSARVSDPRAGGLTASQQIQGRGSVTRLSELWLSKGWFDDRLDIKGGRFAVSDEFAVEDCLFQNLAFCGSQPGNYVNTIYNSPIGQWALRVKYKLTPELYAQVGAFNVNPSNLDNDNGFKLNGAGTTGTYLPVELVWTPTVNRLPGQYSIGYYKSTADAKNTYRDIYGNSAALSGDDYRTNGSRHGMWMIAKQQVTEHNGDASRGLVLYATATFQDKATTEVDSYQKLAMVYKGPFDARPTDTLGLAVARMHASSQYLRNARNENQLTGATYDDANYVPEQHSEYDMELNYGIQATRWLNIMPNLQYIDHPGGVREVQNAFVAGLQVSSQF